MVYGLIFCVILALIAGTAIAYIFGSTAVLTFLVTGNGQFLSFLPQRIVSQLNVFALMSLPLFILTGEIMNRAGITDALIGLSQALIGRIRGSLGYVNILTSVFFAGISGSAIADAAALSKTLVPAMKKKGYDPIYAAAITAASSIIGPIIPPSIGMIFYGAVMQTSIPALFAGGIVPGLLIALGLMIANGFYAYRDRHPGGRHTELPPLLPSVTYAIPALLLPVIIVSGMVFGVATPTEAAALAAVAAVGVGYLYRRLNRHLLGESLGRAVSLTGAIFMILCAMACLDWLLGLMGVPTILADIVGGLGLSATEYILVLSLIFLVTGMFLEPPVQLALLVPTLVPTGISLGLDPVHVGVVLMVNMAIGLASPPVGACIAVVSTVTGVSFAKLCRALIPFILVEIAVLAVLVLVPELTLFLPRSLGLLGPNP